MTPNIRQTYFSSPGAVRTGRWVPLRIKLVFLLLILLVMSSGAVIYTDTPLLYYGVIAIGFLIVIILVYFGYYLAQGKPSIFNESDTNDFEKDTGQSEGLEKVFKAERAYKKESAKESKAFKVIKPPNDLKLKEENQETMTNENRRKSNKSKDKMRKHKLDQKIKQREKRIGSISLEESQSLKRQKISEKVEQSEMSETTEKSKKGSKVTTFLCPTCGSKELYYEAGLISGYKYHCKDCDYIGSFIIEKDFEV